MTDNFNEPDRHVEPENADIEFVKGRELDDIVRRRNNVNGFQNATTKDEVKEQLVGLALSGGGVRSGATSLGLLQAFHDNNVIEYCDYLSTVSGGSYAGAFLSSDVWSQDRDVNSAPSNKSGPFHDCEKRTTPRMLKFIFGGYYLRDTIGFLNRQFFGMILLLVFAISGLVLASSIIAWLVRSLDHQEVRYFVRTLGFVSEISLAFLPALVALLVWFAARLWAYVRGKAHKPTLIGRITIFVFILFLLVGVANIVSTGDLLINAATHTKMFQSFWSVIVSAVVLSILPLLSPRKLLRSGTKPRNPVEKYWFWLATNGLLYGIPFLFVGILIQENVSKINDVRSGRIVARSELRHWGTAMPSNEIWTSIIENQCCPERLKLKIDSEELEKEGWHPPLYSGSYGNDLYNRVTESESEPTDWSKLFISKEEYNIPNCLTALSLIASELRDRENRSIWKNWVSLPKYIFGDDDNEFFKHHQRLRDEGLIKNAMAEWLGQQMKSPEFASLFGCEIAGEEPAQIFNTITQLKRTYGDRPVQEKNFDQLQYENLNRDFLLALFPDQVEEKSVVKSYVCLKADQTKRSSIAFMSLFVFVATGLFVNLNAISCHTFYRNKLSEMWIEEKADRYMLMSEMANVEGGYPYHLIVGSMAYFGRYDHTKYPEKFDHFLFSRRFCGSERTGFTETKNYMRGGLALRDAIAISGAAISVIHFRNSLVMFLLFITNLRLGQWLDNPKLGAGSGNNLITRTWRSFSKSPIGLSLNAFRNTDRRPYVFVADGGYFDNTGVDELVRRRCKLIIAMDAGADPEFKMEDVSRVFRWCRMKHGVSFEPVSIDKKFDGDFIEELTPQFKQVDDESTSGRSSNTRRSRKQKFSASNYLLWKVRYPVEDSELTQQTTRRRRTRQRGIRYQTGVLIYLKNTLVGKEPLELIKYKANNSEFPHDSTGDQFFAPGRFESYRMLGQYIGRSAIEDIKKRIDEEEMDEEVVECLRLLPPFKT